MNKIITLLLLLFCFTLLCINANAQNIFPATGKVGIGTATPATLLQVRGTSRFGSLTNYASIDTGGNLGFAGSALYRVSGNRYVFRYTGTQAYGLYFNLTNTRYELRDSNGVTSAMFGANDGNVIFRGGVKVGNSTSNSMGTIRFTGTDFQGYAGGVWKSLTTGTVYTPGSGISISGTTITNTAPDIVVAITPFNGLSVTGSYPNFSIGNIATPWIVTGNTGTDPSVNFIGTTDAQPLVLRVNKIISGKLDTLGNVYMGIGAGLSGNGYSNIAIGKNALQAYNGGELVAIGVNSLANDISGIWNTGVGSFTLKNHSTGNLNTAVGYAALNDDISGISNTAIGAFSLYNNATGLNNTATGTNSLLDNASGSYNAALGAEALHSNTSQSYNTAVGASSLKNNGNGASGPIQATRNTAVGEEAMVTNTTGFYNTALGSASMFYNTTGADNTAIGLDALEENTGGNDNTAIGIASLGVNISGNYNTASGSRSLTANSTGTENTADGYSALYSDTAGSYNTAGGAYSLYANTGSYNTAYGHASLYSNTSGTFNTATGKDALYTNTTGSYNTADGKGALATNNTGISNTAVGYTALYFNAAGSHNTATGYQALFKNTASYNTANGDNTLYFNTSGSGNTATGAEALYTNTTGNGNSATGYQALYYNLSGGANTAAGYSSLYSNTSGANNTANGYNSLFNNTTGNNNTAHGFQSLYFNLTGNYNAAIGDFALYHNVLGNDNTATGSSALANNTDGSENTASGKQALYINANGTGNTATGSGALLNNNANYNTAAGYQALYNNITGNNNTAIGTNALVSVKYGIGNIGIGFSADADTAVKNDIGIGTSIKLKGDNTALIGNAATVALIGPLYVTGSDGRFKKDIKENVPGLDFIKSLRPVTFRYKSFDLQKFLLQNDPKMLSEINQSDYQEAESKLHMGFIAQEVQQVVDSKNYGVNIVKKPVSASDNYGLAYSEFIAPLVKAVQELSVMNDSKDARIDSLQNQLNDLKAMVLSIQQKQNECSPCSAANTSIQTYNTTLTSGASLDQNVPNPFTRTTTIGYTLPQQFGSAQIVITTNTGVTLKAVTVSGSGKGVLNVDAATLASGAYYYSLIVDGKLIGTKQMVLAR